MLIVKLPLLLVLFLCVTSMKTGLLMIPGLGEQARLSNVRKNIDHLSRNKVFLQNWDCVVFVYDESVDVSSIAPYCSIKNVPGEFISSNIKQITPEFVKKSGYQYVFLLLDDIRLSLSRVEVKHLARTMPRHRRPLDKPEYDNFDLDRLIRVMVLNNMTLIQPRVVGANPHVKKNNNWRLMAAAPLSVMNTAGCIHDAIEMFAYVMTPPAYHALWNLTMPAINPFGWGPDVWYDGYARLHVPGHKMGVLSAMDTVHVHHFQPKAAAVHGKPGYNPGVGMQKLKRYFNNTYGLDLGQFLTDLQGKHYYYGNETKKCTRAILNA